MSYTPENERLDTQNDGLAKVPPLKNGVIFGIYGVLQPSTLVLEGQLFPPRGCATPRYNDTTVFHQAPRTSGATLGGAVGGAIGAKFRGGAGGWSGHDGPDDVGGANC